MIKKGLKILGIISCIFIFIVVAFFIKLKLTKVPVVEMQNIDLTRVQDGSYIGEYSTETNKAKVKVNVKSNKIISIDILKHENGLGEKAEKLIEDVVNQQTVDVDNVSGATASSNVIKKAIENALLRSTDIKE